MSRDEKTGRDILHGAAIILGASKFSGGLNAYSGGEWYYYSPAWLKSAMASLVNQAADKPSSGPRPVVVAPRPRAKKAGTIRVRAKNARTAKPPRAHADIEWGSVMRKHAAKIAAKRRTFLSFEGEDYELKPPKPVKKGRYRYRNRNSVKKRKRAK